MIITDGATDPDTSGSSPGGVSGVDPDLGPAVLGTVLARRGLVLGAGAMALAAGTLAAVRPAEAKPGPVSPAAAHTDASPVVSTIASAAISGYTYRHVSWLDFFPESGTGYRAWGGYGVYSSGSTSTMWATVEVPTGSLVRDIEWYVRNVSGVSTTALGRLWAAGVGTLYTTLADTTITSQSVVVAYRSAVPSTAYGPHPLGTRIVLGINTGTDPTIQVNGARVGFSQGSGAVGMLPTPIRAYDSRNNTKLSGGTVRTVTLASSLVPPGTSAIVVNVTVTGAEGNGNLRVYPGSGTLPEVSTVNFRPGVSIANATIVGVSSSRQVKILSSHNTHVILDVSGTIG